MANKKIIFLYIIIILAIGAIIYFRDQSINEPLPSPIVTESKQPPVIKETDIIVDQPKANETVSSPLLLSGRAHGTWYFEASFPIQLLDANGTELAVAIAQAQGDWMTTDYVPFSATINLTTKYQGPATLVFKKDNPSGLPENERQITIPVTIQ